MSFSDGIAGFAKRAGAKIDDAVASVCAETSVRIIKKTPRRTGRAKGNWFASINIPSSETSETRKESEAISDAMIASNDASGKIFYLTNNLKYIRPLEYGWSKQAPEGMLRISIAETENKLRGF
jgi:hypothetical protein